MTRKESFKLFEELELAYRAYNRHKKNGNELMEVVCKYHANKMENLLKDMGISEEDIKVTKKYALTE